MRIFVTLLLILIAKPLFASDTSDLTDTKIFRMPDITDFIFQDMVIPRTREKMHYAFSVKEGIHWHGWLSKCMPRDMLSGVFLEKDTDFDFTVCTKSYSPFQTYTRPTDDVTFFISYSFIHKFSRQKIMTLCTHIDGYRECSIIKNSWGSFMHFILRK